MKATNRTPTPTGFHFLAAPVGSVTATGIAADLRALAEQTGDRTYARAAKAMAKPSGAPGGRPEINDRALIREALWLVGTGKARSLNRAFLMVAKSAPGAASLKSVAARLRRKHQAEKIS